MSKSFVCNGGVAKSSLHSCHFEVGRQLQSEPLQQNALVLGRPTDTALADRRPRPCRHHDVHQGNLLQLSKDFARLVSQSGLVTEPPQRLPEDIRQEANQDGLLDKLKVRGSQTARELAAIQ